MNTLQWLSRLIGFDTTSRNSNLDLINCVQDWMQQHGAICRLTHDAKEKKTNLFATLPSAAGSMHGGLILSGHTDVVPVDGQEWETNPFLATERDGKIYGRGACDMKGFLAVALALVPDLAQRQLAKPVHFAFSYDEEVGCRGAPLLIADLQRAGIQPEGCIVGEPTEMQPVIAHKGIQVFRCRVTGHAAHSSLTPQGCNAIDYAAELICYLRDLAQRIRAEGLRDDYFDVPYTSVSTNMIQGGNAHNTIPALCEFIFEFRHLPSIKPQTILSEIEAYISDVLLPRMQQERSTANIELENLAAAPGFEADNQSVLLQWAREIAQQADILKVAYATEAGQFQAAGIPTIVCGPGSIEQAHRANEFVEITQLERCRQFLENIIVKFDTQTHP